MKIIILLAFAFTTMSVASAACTTPAWQSLELDEVTGLSQPLEFPRTNHETVVIDSGSPYRLFDVRGIDGLSVLLLTFQTEKCPDKWTAAYAEMILVDPSKGEDGRDRSVGIELNGNCELKVYVETKDYGTCGLFLTL